MLRSTLLLAFVCLASLSFAEINAILEVKSFNSPSGPYIETYVNVYPEDLNIVQLSDSTVGYAAEITVLIKKGTDILTFEKVTLNSPTIPMGAPPAELLDLQRFKLPNGDYTVEVEIEDPNNRENKTSLNKEIQLTYDNSIVQISDVELLDSYGKSTEESKLSKSGMDMIPLVTDFYPAEFTKMAYYFEIYGSKGVFGEDSKFIATHFIQNRENMLIAGSYKKTKKMSSEEVVPVINVFDIRSLPTGNYFLVVQVRNKENELVAEKKQSFQRLTPEVDVNTDHLKDVSIAGTFMDRVNKDSIQEFIDCLDPLCTDLERKIVVRHLETMGDSAKYQFFYSFWLNRYPQEPEKHWTFYKSRVKQADGIFGTSIKRGYQTDRGRIFLKYGPPNSISDNPHTAQSYPYQIWHYYKIGQFNNKRFVFYQPDLITNDYEMLHSDLQGEIQNYNWEKDLHIRDTPGGDIDDRGENTRGTWGREAHTLFSNP